MMFTFSEKSLDLLCVQSRIDVLEGTARSSKTTTGLFKFGLRLNNSTQRQFMISGIDAVTAKRNLVDSKNGFLEQFDGYVKYGTDPSLGTHLIFVDDAGVRKYIYIVGFKDKARWEKVLGSTTGGVFVDEGNLATEDFLAQVMRSGASVDVGICVLH